MATFLIIMPINHIDKKQQMILPLRLKPGSYFLGMQSEFWCQICVSQWIFCRSWAQLNCCKLFVASQNSFHIQEVWPKLRCNKNFNQQNTFCWFKGSQYEWYLKSSFTNSRWSTTVCFEWQTFRWQQTQKVTFNNLCTHRPFRKYPLRRCYLLNKVHAGLASDQTSYLLDQTRAYQVFEIRSMQQNDLVCLLPPSKVFPCTTR